MLRYWILSMTIIVIARGDGNASVPTSADVPIVGRPPAFTGAVGRFGVAATVEPSSIQLGQSFSYTLQIRGTGDLSNASPPSLLLQRGFRDRFDNLGPPQVERLPDGLEYRYELTPRSVEIARVPAFLFPYFDPEQRRFETARAPSIDVAVQPLEVIGPSSVPETTEIPSGNFSGGYPSADQWGWMAAIVGLCLVIAIIVRKRLSSNPSIDYSKKNNGESAPVVAASEVGKQSFVERFAGSEHDPSVRAAREFIEALGTNLALPPGSWTHIEIITALNQRCDSPEMLHRASELLGAIEQRRFSRGKSVHASDALLTEIASTRAALEASIRRQSCR